MRHAAEGVQRIACPTVREFGTADGRALDVGSGAVPVPDGYWVYRRTDELTVFTCDPRDAEPALPGKMRMALNLARTLVTAGLATAPQELQDTRREICESHGGACPGGKRRISDDRCSDCGCHLGAKRALAGAACPLAYW